MININTVTIGIPAYNEQVNIKSLLNSVLTQNSDYFLLKQIIISSDGSNDKTVEEVRKIMNSKIIIIENSDRKGIARGLNQIISKTKSDILITLDGDISILDVNFLDNLIYPIISQKADLTSSSIKEKLPSTFYGKMILVSMLLKETLFEVFKSGNNIYTCHGLARAYSKKFYKSLYFPVSIGNDMYSYLKCIKEKYKYIYTPKAVAWYKVPQNYTDHKKQSTRFFKTISEQKKYFDPGLVEKETKIPLQDYLIAALKSLSVLIKYPIYSFAYFILQLYLRIISGKNLVSETWNTAVSTK
jgi:glycosyltransferase involved in cell wall biosynthesis